MERRPVESTSIASIGYEAATNRMEVEFSDGTIYLYHLVTEQIYQSLLNADSLGHFFGEEIRPKYRAERIQ